MAEAQYSPTGGKRTSISNTGKPTRTSLSILKPLKARCPLQDLDLVPNTEDDTTNTTSTFTAMRRRRVSFAGVNKVKEFHTAAESLTVHHTPAYDEPFTTTMSSDSSSHHHLTDSKISDGTGLDHMSLTSCINTNFSSEIDAVLDLTVKSTDNSCYKGLSGLDFECKENFAENFRMSQNTCYEADMECTTPHIPNHLYYDSKNSSFANKSLEFSSMMSGFSGVGSNKSSMMEFTEMIHGPTSFLQNERGSKQCESMEFIEQVEAQTTGEKDFDDSFSSAYLQSNPDFFRNVQNDSDFGMEFTEPLQRVDIFNNQNSINSKSEPALSDSNPLDQANSIFSSQGNVTKNEFNDSNEMSFGMTGVVSQPLIECLQIGTNCELEISNNTTKNASTFVDFVGQNVEVEHSNNEGSEMSITEANGFGNPLNAIHNVSANLETSKKSIFENSKVKQSDHVLSFLRSYSGTDKNVSTLSTSHNLSSESTETIKKSIMKQNVNSSSDHQLTNSHLSNLSIVKNHSMELTNALSNNLKSNSSVSETSVAQTSSVEFTNASGISVGEMSISRNSSMEFTKAVTNNIRLNDTTSHSGNLSTLSSNMKSNSSVCEVSTAKTSTMGGSSVHDMSVSRNTSMEFTKAMSNNMRLGDTNSLGDASALSNNVKPNSSVGETSVSKTSSTEENNVCDLSVSKNGTMEFTKPVPNNIRLGERIVSFTEDSSKSVNLTSEDIFSKMAETSSVESFHDKENSIFETEETMSSDFKENPRIINHVHNPENLPEDKCGTVLDAIDFNSTNVVTSTQETKSSENAPLSENSTKEKLAVVSDTVDFNASNVITSTQESKSSQSMNATNGRKSISVEAFLRINAPVERKGGANFDCVNQEILALEMKLTKNMSNNIQSSNLDCDDSLSQPLSETNENQCNENKPASSQESSGSQPMELTNVITFDEKTIPDDDFGIDNSLTGATSRVESVKDKRKSRRSELFVPLQKPLLSRDNMNIIEESEFSNDSESHNSASNICNENSSQAFATVNENDGADKMRCEGLPTPKPLHIFNSNMVKSKPIESEVSFDFAYKINDSQMFTKSMLEQTSHDESSVSELLKPNDSESAAVGGRTGGTLLASMKSFNVDDVSLSCELFTSLNIETKKALTSESNITSNIAFSQNDVIESIVNEDTQTFSRLLKTPFEVSKNSTLIKPMMDSTVMANIFEESQFTLPVENIPRSVFFKDDVDCPSFCNKSGLTLPDVFDHEISQKQNISTESFLESHESSAKTEPSQEVLDEKKLIEGVNKIPTKENADADNDGQFGSEYENLCAKDDNPGSPDLCNVSFPEAEFTINEEMLKNITIDRCKSRKSVRKERHLTELDDSITLRHEESVKKVKILEESCNMTGISKLPDFTVNSAEVSPLSDKSVLLSDEIKMDVSVMVANLSLNDENMCTLNSDHSDPEKLGNDSHSEKIVNKMHEPKVSIINTSSHEIPDISVSDYSNQSNPLEAGSKEFPNLGQEQNPKSCLKKVQNFSSAAKSTTIVDSALKQTIVSSEVKNVYFVESGPRKRGFVRKAAVLYETFVGTTTPTSEQIKTATKLSECKRVLDENYPKEKQTHLKVQQYLEAVAPNANANTSIITDIEADIDMATPHRVVPEEYATELSTFSPENNFEKSSYVPSASSNTSMIVHEDHDSRISPIFKTPKSMVKNRSVSSVSSPKTPCSSPARKKQKLPFGSTPVKKFNNKEEESEMQASDSGSQQYDSLGNNSSPNTEPLSETPSPKKLCSEFLERFEAETRATKKEWNVLEANSTEWSFEFLDGHLQLIIHFKAASSNAPVSVKSITFSSVPSDYKPIEVIGQTILLEKYPAQRLRSLCKNSSGVFDVLHMIGNDAIFARKVMYSLEGMFLAVFTNSSVVIELTSLRPNHLAEVTVDLSSWKSLSSSSISIENWIGNIRLPKIRSLFEECEKNHDCVRQFYNKCLNYINSINCAEAAC